MAKFLLIDHSLRSAGGHHYDYAVQSLRAAERAGFEACLATNRKFEGLGSLPSRWPTFPQFVHDTYSRHCLYFAHQYIAPANSPWHAARRILSRSWHGVWRVLAASSRRRQLRQFTAACRELFRHVDLQPGDHVFLPTISEFDLAGLVACLREWPAAQEVHWHLQFHFGIFEGREPEYEAQAERATAMREQLAQSMAQLPGQRVYLYNTTDQLAAQYNRLGIGHFQALPYPVSSDLQHSDEDANVSTLRVTCAGHLRREKGRHQLSELVEQLWPARLSTGQLQLVLQCQPARLRRLLTGHLVGRLAEWNDSRSPVQCVGHPLSAARYVQLVRQSHIGLFLYDSRRYYARCSGILVEMLAAGVPVLVPAGCWLSQQIAEANFRYLEQLQDGLPPPAWQQPLLDISSSDRSLDLAWPTGTKQMMVSFRVRHARPGTFIRLQSTWQDADGHQHRGPVHIVGPRVNGAAHTMLNVTGESGQLQMRCAYGDGSCQLTDFSVRFFAPSADAQPHPLGSVGLTFAEFRDLPQLIDELARHYDHYRASTQRFSQRWREDHRAERVVELLQRNAQQSAKSRLVA